MRILVIGKGSVGERHHRNLCTLGVESRWLRLAEFMESGKTGRLLDLDHYDGAVVATATTVRLDVIRKFAAAGLPLYIEKPLAFRPDDVRDILTICRGIASRSLVGFMMRYHPAVRYLADQDLAGVYSFAFEIGHDVGQWRPGRMFSGSYASESEGGGVLLDLCHELDMAWQLFPEARTVSVSCLGHADWPGVDFCTRVELGGRSRASGTVAMDYLSPVPVRRIVLRGIDGSYDFDLANNEFLHETAERRRFLPLGCERNAMFLAAMEDFLGFVSGQPPTPVRLTPRLDHVGQVCMRIAEAWDARQFNDCMLSSGDFR